MLQQLPPNNISLYSPQGLDLLSNVARKMSFFKLFQWIITLMGQADSKSFKIHYFPKNNYELIQKLESKIMQNYLKLPFKMKQNLN